MAPPKKWTTAELERAAIMIRELGLEVAAARLGIKPLSLQTIVAAERRRIANRPAVFEIWTRPDHPEPLGEPDAPGPSWAGSSL